MLDTFGTRSQNIDPRWIMCAPRSMNCEGFIGRRILLDAEGRASSGRRRRVDKATSVWNLAAHQHEDCETETSVDQRSPCTKRAQRIADRWPMRTLTSLAMQEPRCLILMHRNKRCSIVDCHCHGGSACLLQLCSSCDEGRMFKPQTWRNINGSQRAKCYIH